VRANKLETPTIAIYIRHCRKEEIMSFNVKNGTRMHGPSLCETCTRAHIVQGYRESEILILCRATWDPQRSVPFAVIECSSYVAKNSFSLDDMEEIAWTIAPRGPKRAAGFVAPGGSTDDQCEFEIVLKEEEE
jgi:hypothetical protein